MPRSARIIWASSLYRLDHSYALTFVGYNAGPGRAPPVGRSPDGDPRGAELHPVDGDQAHSLHMSRNYVQKVTGRTCRSTAHEPASRSRLRRIWAVADRRAELRGRSFLKPPPCDGSRPVTWLISAAADLGPCRQVPVARRAEPCGVHLRCRRDEPPSPPALGLSRNLARLPPARRARLASSRGAAELDSRSHYRGRGFPTRTRNGGTTRRWSRPATSSPQQQLSGSSARSS